MINFSVLFVIVFYLIGAAVYHDEVDLVPEEPHIFETSVDLQGRRKRERVEQKLQVNFTAETILVEIFW